MVQKRTRNGQIIDFDAMLAAGQKERAIGNMDVNAKGDVVKAGEVVKTNEDRVREYYETVKEVAQEQVSLKGASPETSGKLKPDATTPEVKTANTQKENVRTAPKQEAPAPTPTPEPEAPLGESFDEQEPLGFKEVELPNGDIEMVPYYTEEDSPDAEDNTKN